MRPPHAPRRGRARGVCPPTRTALTLGVVAALALTAAANAAVVPSVFGGRVPCVEQSGVQFCAGSFTARVESWDGVPLDANVTLPPASMDGPFPLIVDLHGWGAGKNQSVQVEWATEGYAVLSYSARGFHGSCGVPAARGRDETLADPDVCATRGWIHLADARYEVRDSQHLAGLLADEGLVVPDRIGVTGVSYGGGQSMILAALRNRTMLPDGTLVPWRSPGGLDMTVAAAAPVIPWSDLAAALTPNGHTLDYRTLNPYGARGGVQKASYYAVLYPLGQATGHYAPPGADPAADLQGWRTRIEAGEPYDGDPFLLDLLDEITTYHSAYYVDDAVVPAPMLIYSAWTDDLVPAEEAVRFWRKTTARHPQADIALHFADAFGHGRASLGGNVARLQARVRQLFSLHLKGADGPALPRVEVYTQGCNGAAEEGPITADGWDALHPGEVRHVARRTQRFDGRGGRAETAAAVDPLAGGPCRTVPADDDPGAATYRLPAAKGAGYTLLGAPTVIADVAATSDGAQVAARLWDVAPDGTQTLVTHGFHRPRTDNAGRQVFQLPPNGWRFAAGHVPKLELLGQSAPFGRPSNGTFVVTVSRVELRLPVHEPADGRTIMPPAPPVLPLGDAEPLGCPWTPAVDCAAPDAARRSKLAIVVGASAGADRLAWRWRRADAAAGGFGDPLAATDYALCVYDGEGELLLGALAAASGACADRPCWAATGTGFRYADRRLARTGLRRLELRTSPAGPATLTVAGKGARLAVPALPVATLPVTVQLVNSDGVCWGATFGAARRNTGRVFKATSE
jgi:hypothetical protein